MINVDSKKISDNQLSQINDFAGLLVKKGVKSVCVEAGHIYIDEKPTEQHRSSLKLGGILAEVIGKVVPKVTRMLFVDDYNPASSILILPEYLKLAGTLGFSPDVIVWESSLVADARALVDKLSKIDETIIDANGHTHTRHQNIRLHYVDDRLACCSLDAALYIKRFSEYDFNITILPGESECEYKK